MKNKWLGYYAIFIVTMTIILSFLPGHNGDLPFYIACVIEKEYGPGQDVLQKTKQVLKQELPASEFAAHAKRIDNAEQNILDFYRVKPLYVTMVEGLHRLGFSYIFSTLLPSIIAYCLIGILAFLWASRVLQPVQAFAISAVCMLLNPAIVLARLSSPDAVSQFVLLAAFYSIYFEKKKYLILFLLLLSIWVRMDNLITVVVLLTAMRCWPLPQSQNRLNNKTYLILIIIAIGFAVTMNYYYEPDFLWFKKTSNVYRWQQSWGQYGRYLLIYFLSLNKSLFAALILFFIVIQSQVKFSIKEKSGYFLLILLVVFIVRLIIFPLFEERFATSCYIAAILLFAERLNMLKPQLNK